MRQLLIGALLLFGLAGPAGADPVADLYAAQVAVHDQSTETRAAALVDALAQVLVKVTGSRAVLDTAEAQALLENPSRYLQQFRYESVRPVPTDPAAPRLALHAEFDGAALERRLRAAGLPLWGRERPLTLGWVAFSDTADRQLLGADSGEPVVDALRRAAVRRGLPFTLPLLDAEDATRVSFMDVWGAFEEPLLAAAKRYAPDAVFAGSIFRAGDELWAGRWTLLRDGERQRWEASGATPEAVAVAAIDALAEHYASEFAVVAPIGAEGRTLVEIVDVDELRDYARVESYLRELSVVDDVRLLSVDDARLRFELKLNASVRALEQAIALGRVLEAVPMETVVRLGAETARQDGAIANVPLTAEGVELAREERVLQYRYRH